MIFMGCFPKFGAVFAAMPGWLVGGLYMCLFGLICSCGLAQLQHVDLNSSRNLFILGFCMYNGLSLAGAGGYFNVTADWGAPCTDSANAKVFFNNTMVVALIAGVILDNLIPGTREVRVAGISVRGLCDAAMMGSDLAFSVSGTWHDGLGQDPEGRPHGS